MRTEVDFRTDLFPPYEGEEEEINPGAWGKRLAEFLHAKLSTADLVNEDIFAEDWGWVTPVANKRFSLWIGVGNFREDPQHFGVFIRPNKPLIRRFLFQKIDTRTDITRLADSLDTILRSEPGITEIHWKSTE